MSDTVQKSDDLGQLSINDFSNDRIFGIVDLAKDYAVHKGICMRNEKLTFDARIPATFCLFPSSFPEIWFHFARDVQCELNYVLHKVAHSSIFLHDCLKSTIEQDEFTARIWKIYKTIEAEGAAQPVSFGLIRCDYMLNANDKGEILSLKQIENNTFASSFSGLSSKLLDLHRYVLERCGYDNLSSKLPENPARVEFAKGMVAAWDQYGKTNAAILFVVEEVVYNICDQRELEFAIHEIESSIKIIRYTFNELQKSSSLSDKLLYVDGVEIAVVYYRSGYVPDQYTDEDWTLRLMMERSLAIKCPSVGYHLAGTKAVQLHLSRPGIVEQFLPEGSNARRIREVFAKQYSLDMDADGDKAVALGIANPEDYVLKPEREGGGHNVFGKDIEKVLSSIGQTKARKAYILMEKINPPQQQNIIVRSQEEPITTSVVSELGIYGVILGTKEKVLKNYQAGHLLRTRQVGINEVGIAAGFGALDSPSLT